MNDAPSLRRPRRCHWSAVRASKAVGDRVARPRRARAATVGRVLLVVALLDGGRVLVPVRVERVVLVEHELQPLVVEPEHVADVAGVLERRPDARRRGGRGRRGAAAPVPRTRRCRGPPRRPASRSSVAASKPHSGQGCSRTQVQSLRVGHDQGWPPAGSSRPTAAAASCRSGRSGCRCPSAGRRRSRSTGSSGSRRGPARRARPASRTRATPCRARSRGGPRAGPRSPRARGWCTSRGRRRTARAPRRRGRPAVVGEVLAPAVERPPSRQTRSITRPTRRSPRLSSPSI